ncbi:LysR family transcriptional regulator [Sideroxydans sp. CL21]|uniref:LysR family transcriptional regulator n=1 Tax=Sideroxydans sp. CL21 TaxID=2600596 RepID=UPI0024BCEAA9|nr:LysR family transcriptional regulator [Sideroxydans sp. CL21]
MDKFESMRIFARIVELKSFTRAAEDLRYPKSTVTNAIKQLEAHLRVRLLNRTTRLVTPTLDGEAYYARCARLLADLEETENVFTDAVAKPGGLLRVDMHGTLARHFVLPQLNQFCERYPNIELQIGIGDRLVDLVKEGVDCVLRVGELQDSSMIARRLAMLEQVTVASPEYLKQYGEPQTIGDLDRHHAVNFFSSQTGKFYPFEFKVNNEVRQIDIGGKISVNNADAYVACCRSGFGLIQAPRYGIAGFIATGELREVLPDCRPAPAKVSVLYPHRQQLSPRVRVFVDWLANIFSVAH